MTNGFVETLESCRVLVVDDDPAVRLLTRTILEESSHTVFECQDGAAALESFLHVRPDVLLLDVVLPGKDGFEVCQEIRALPQGHNQ